MKKVLILILLMSGGFVLESHAQKVALKSNLLYDATTTLNLGLEIGLVIVFQRVFLSAKLKISIKLFMNDKDIIVN